MPGNKAVGLVSLKSGPNMGVSSLQPASVSGRRYMAVGSYQLKGLLFMILDRVYSDHMAVLLEASLASVIFTLVVTTPTLFWELKMPTQRASLLFRFAVMPMLPT